MIRCMFFSTLLLLGDTGTSSGAEAPAAWRSPAGAPLLTRWATLVDPAKPLPEYPRPQLVRTRWMNLNGLWQFAEAAAGEVPPSGKNLSGTILVPYPVESALSGVMRPFDRLWYRRTFDLPAKWRSGRVLLHFGAVDWEATVYVNGRLVGSHRGGYDPFSLDITESLRPGSRQEIVVGVFDPSDAGEQPRGKQVKKPEGIWYTPSTGIWQTVWLEPVPATHIRDLRIDPVLDREEVRLTVQCAGSATGDTIEAIVSAAGNVVTQTRGPVGREFAVPIREPRPWSPASPFLYDLRLRVLRKGRTVDEAGSYFGMRSIKVARDERGINRLLLNGEFQIQIGPLDQGFWPDGLYTAPTDAALRYDIEVTRQLGFTMARKHVKVEPDRWYYWADRLGLLVWQDMPSGNNATPESRQQFERELTRLVESRRNHPSVIMWVVFNEGWGQFDTERLTALVKTLDPTRLVNNVSGWTDKGVGDVMDIHNYPKPKSPPPESARAVVLGEFGGLGLAIPHHTWKKEHWGYQGMKSRDELTDRYGEFLRDVYSLRESSGLCAAVYTQTTDVEIECNGLLTYDREIIKPDAERIAAANRGDFSRVPPPAVIRSVVPTSMESPQVWRYTLEQPGPNWTDPAFDDNGWKKGMGGFGTTDREEAAARTTWGTSEIWLRRAFTLPKGNHDSLFVLLHHDDEAQVFINGVRAVDVGGWTWEYRLYPVSADARAGLREGKNTLAVYCRQHAGSQYIDAGLVSITAPPSADRLPPGTRITSFSTILPRMRAGWYTQNRSPLVPAPLMKLPVGAIRPLGWLKKMLELERDGLTGRLKEISPWLDATTSAWASGTGEGTRGWEELPYWLKGYGDLGYVLKDENIIREARFWIDAAMSSQREDGWFGPRALLTSLHGKPDMWPHMVMLNAMQSYYEYSGDQRILPFMLRYFRWQHNLPVEAFGEGYWPKLRMGDNIESVYWLYNRTGEEWLLDLARKIHEGMARWDRDIINWHNVNIAQGFRAPAVYYPGGRDIMLLRAAERNYRRVMDLYGQFPGGGFAADENARPGFGDPRQGFETCGIVEFMHSFEMLSRISGAPVWSDRCEDIAFNSFPAALTPDMKALRYLTCANQIQLDKNTKSPGVQNGGTMFSYSPFEVYRCCQHNVSHGWPYFAEELWLATADSGLCASLYAPSEVTAHAGDGAIVTIRQETTYPFGGEIRLRVTAPGPVRFPLYLRIPAWAREPGIRINGTAHDIAPVSNCYLRVEREWNPGDELVLTLDMKVRVRTWEKNNNAVSVHYGPLAFALEIPERWEQYGNNSTWPEWEVFPAGTWNYGLEVDPADPAASFTLMMDDKPPVEFPFTASGTPLKIRATGRRIPGWQQDYLGMVGPLQPGPAHTTEPPEHITLIPMGAARLRISAFPTVTTGTDGHVWSPPPKPRPIDFEITVSHLNRYDTREAVADGFEPKNSADEGVAKLTWWNHRGTSEWVQYEFPVKKNISSASVYWFDDGADGAYRVPQSWRLLYRKGDTWVPVEGVSDFGTARDTFNKVSFTPVTTSGLRLEVQLQKDYCGGILEWKFSE